MPKRLLVIGSGAIGIEFASFYNTLGAETTVVEVLDRILPVEDEEISAFAKKAFEKQGMTILRRRDGEGARSRRRQGHGDDRAGRQDRRPPSFDTVISAVGIVGNVENLGLEALGREGRPQPRRRRRVLPHRRRRALRHRRRRRAALAGAQGDPRGRRRRRADRRRAPASGAAGGDRRLHLLPAAGRQRRHDRGEGQGAGHEVKVGRFPFIGNGKAIALGEPEGLVKTVFDAKTGELLGAHMIGAEVTELIQGYVIARTLETTEAELIETVFPHPTLSETMHEAVLDAYGRMLHF